MEESARMGCVTLHRWAIEMKRSDKRVPYAQDDERLAVHS